MISLITSHNKNPMINFERIDWKHQKPKFSIGSKFSPKCMKKCMKYENKWKRRGKSVLPKLEDKNPWKFLRENDKKLPLNLDRSKRERERTFEKVWIVIEHVKNLWFKKNLWTIFDWSKNRFDRSKITFNWSRTNRAKQIQNKILIVISIGRETGLIDWNSGKTKFWKTKHFNAETPQSTIYYE